jgi:hypothetical protein
MSPKPMERNATEGREGTAELPGAGGGHDADEREERHPDPGGQMSPPLVISDHDLSAGFDRPIELRVPLPRRNAGLVRVLTAGPSDRCSLGGLHSTISPALPPKEGDMRASRRVRGVANPRDPKGHPEPEGEPFHQRQMVLEPIG